MKVRVVFDDARPDFLFDTETAGSTDPFDWDGQRRAESLRPLQGYAQGVSRSLGSKAMLRADDLEREGLRLDVTWYNCLVSEGVERVSHYAGVEMFGAAEEAGRAVRLVAPEDVPHVVQVDVDDALCLQRRHGGLCRVDRTRAAAQSLACLETGLFRQFYDVGDKVSVAKDQEALSAGTAPLLHELVRRAHPELLDRAATAARGLPVWDEAAICAAHGYPEAAWWRCAMRDRFEGGFYSGLDPDVADLLTVWPAVAWFRERSGEEAAVQDALDWFGLEGKAAFAKVKAAWPGLPDEDLTVAWESAWSAARTMVNGE